jgi:hypothetical protein
MIDTTNSIYINPDNSRVYFCFGTSSIGSIFLCDRSSCRSIGSGLPFISTASTRRLLRIQKSQRTKHNAAVIAAPPKPAASPIPTALDGVFGRMSSVGEDAEMLERVVLEDGADPAVKELVVDDADEDIDAEEDNDVVFVAKTASVWERRTP